MLAPLSITKIGGNMMKKVLLIVALGALMFAATPAQALEDSWDMVASMGVIDDTDGSNRDMVLSGGYTALPLSVEWDAAPAYGEVSNTENKNPGTDNVAIGARVTVELPSQQNAPDYSGNVIQKGLYADGEQIKLQVVRDGAGGHFECRFDGTLTASASAPIVSSTVSNVSDGAAHVAYCARAGNVLTVYVDGTENQQTVSIGSVAPVRNIFVGNKGASGTANDQHFGRNTCSAYGYGSNAPIVYVKNQLEGNC